MVSNISIIIGCHKLVSSASLDIFIRCLRLSFRFWGMCFLLLAFALF